MAVSAGNNVPNDILILIFQDLQRDYNSLFQCALVNHAFHQAASKFLYRRIVLAPQFRVILSLRETPVIPATSNLTSACLPKYAQFVEILEITGYLPSQSASNHTLSSTILNAIRMFQNLRVAVFTPLTFHPDTFMSILKYFVASDIQSSSDHSPETPPRQLPGQDTQNLQELTINTSCTDENNAPILTQITGLSKLSIHSPTRAILDLLPDWLRRLSDSLTELHLKDNCGSVTPGVLRSIVPLIQRNILAMSLGLSYSLMDEDVFVSLRNLCGLEKLELRYYWQLRPPKSCPNLTHLRSFTACHTNFQTRKEVQSLCKWVRRTISESPLQVLHIIQDERDEDEDEDDGIPSNTGANVSFRSIIDHICSRHSGTLLVLDMKDAYIDVRSLEKLFTVCKALEEAHLCAGSHALTIFKKHGILLTNLHTASFSIRNIRLSRRRAIDMELVSAIMKHGPPMLRTLSVNRQTWQSAWKCTKRGSVALTIQKQPLLVFPWDRKERPSFRHSEALPPTESPPRQERAEASGPDIEEKKIKAANAGVSGSRLRVRFSEPSSSIRIAE